MKIKDREVLASYDVSSLFINVPVDETIKSITEQGPRSAPIILEKKFFSIEKLLFYWFHRYAIINEDFRQWALWYAVNWFLHLGHAIWRPFLGHGFYVFSHRSRCLLPWVSSETRNSWRRRHCNQYGTLNVGAMACFRYMISVKYRDIPSNEDWCIAAVTLGRTIKLLSAIRRITWSTAWQYGWRREPERIQTEKALQDFRFLSKGKPIANQR